MSANDSNEIILKLILIGDSNVGKTTLINKYIDGSFSEEIPPTIGLENRVKTLEIKGLKVKLQIWDTAGQEKFNSLSKQYFQNSDGILLVFDITNKDSFNNIKKWYDDVISYSGVKAKKLLIGNKKDMKNNVKITKDDIIQFTKQNRMKFIETSAKNNINVEEAFQKIIDLIIDKMSNEDLLEEFGINAKKEHSMSLSNSTLNNMTGEKKKKCC